MKARIGSFATSTMTPAGARVSNCSVIKQAAALLEARERLAALVEEVERAPRAPKPARAFQRAQERLLELHPRARHARRGERADKLGAVEERQVGRARAAERGDIGDDTVERRNAPRLRASHRDDVADRDAGRLLEERQRPQTMALDGTAGPDSCRRIPGWTIFDHNPGVKTQNLARYTETLVAS